MTHFSALIQTSNADSDKEGRRDHPCTPLAQSSEEKPSSRNRFVSHRDYETVPSKVGALEATEVFAKLARAPRPVHSVLSMSRPAIVLNQRLNEVNKREIRYGDSTDPLKVQLHCSVRFLVSIRALFEFSQKSPHFSFFLSSLCLCLAYLVRLMCGMLRRLLSMFRRGHNSQV